MTRVALAWAAGVLEGEGCVRLNVCDIGPTRRWRALLEVVVAMRDKAVVRRLHAMFGGSLCARKDGLLEWKATAARADRTLCSLRPYVVGTKLPQIDAALAYRRSVRPVGRVGRTADDKARALAVSAELSRLKRAR